MVPLSLSSPPLTTFPLNYNNKNKKNKAFLFVNGAQSFTSLAFYNPLSLRLSSVGMAMKKKQKKKGFGTVCYASPLTTRSVDSINCRTCLNYFTLLQQFLPIYYYNAPLETLQVDHVMWVLEWAFVLNTESRVLVFAKGTAIQKSFLVPLLALQAPATVISWIKGEYGMWIAFLALLIRLFLFIPGELELPFLALILVIVAPYQVMNLQGTQQGAIVSLLIMGYLAFQHFSRAGSLQKSIEQGSIIATLAIVCTTAVSLLLLI
ncbi:cold-regulated 413 inner membrane protein 1 [Quercus suber]|uniref:Cold-regulated 413 inner membrane protein 1 n=1 Tax=Quercus suber TaxID=58331 RepID=A0AAW0KS71_QUESU